MPTGESCLDAMKGMLARFEDDGLEHKRTTRVLYATPDGRERVLDRDLATAGEQATDKGLRQQTT